MNNLDKLLSDNGIKLAKKDHALDNMFDSPMDMLDDLFNVTFPAIFKDYKGRKNEI